MPRTNDSKETQSDIGIGTNVFRKGHLSNGNNRMLNNIETMTHEATSTSLE